MSRITIADSAGVEKQTLANPAYVSLTGAVPVTGNTYEISGAVVDALGTVLTVKHAKASITSGQTDSQIVAAVSSKKIRVLSLAALCGGTATDITFNSKGAGAGTAVSMTFANSANGGEVLPRNVDGWFETNAGEGLTATTGAGSTTGVLLTYVEA